MLHHRVEIRRRKRPPLQFLPLGGCGEIGMNLTLYGLGEEWIAVDCGMMIRQDLPDTPLQVPNLATMAALGIVPHALVITHGHEDHIGAAAWLWPQWGCPIYAPPLAAGLLRAKFHERGLSSDVIQVIEPGEAFECGSFSLRYLPLPHSIPESCALLIVTSHYKVLHTGDWKLDPEPIIGAPADERAFRALAPIDLVVGDSTNAPTPGRSRSEGDVARALEETLGQCKGRVIVSCFASNLARVLSVGRAAARTQRRLSLMGRSMERMVAIAKGLGYLDDLPPLVPISDLGYLPPEEVLVLATGSQGEPRAALSRLAENRHPHFELVPGDTVIFSAKAIPGNERLIERLQNALSRLGVAVFEERGHPQLHASGHPAQEELETFYDWLRPRYLLPVHGEPHHQQAHLELARRLDIQAPLLPVNGDLIHFEGDALTLKARHPQPPCIINQNIISPVPGLADNDNRSHKRHGSLFLALSVAPVAHGWTRIGPQILDSSVAAPLDEVAFAEWLDSFLEESEAQDMAELRQQLQPLIMRYLSERLRHLPEVHLQLFAAETPDASTRR